MTRTARLEGEVALIRTRFGDVEVGPDYGWIIVPQWPLPPGWNKDHTFVIILLPPGYPTTPPDNFYTDPDLRLAAGRLPGSTSPNQKQADRDCMQFSYHLEAGEWKPSPDPAKGDNIWSFLAGVKRRLEEVD